MHYKFNDDIGYHFFSTITVDRIIANYNWYSLVIEMRLHSKAIYFLLVFMFMSAIALGLWISNTIGPMQSIDCINSVCTLCHIIIEILSDFTHRKVNLQINTIRAVRACICACTCNTPMYWFVYFARSNARNCIKPTLKVANKMDHLVKGLLVIKYIQRAAIKPRWMQQETIIKCWNWKTGQYKIMKNIVHK